MKHKNDQPEDIDLTEFQDLIGLMESDRDELAEEPSPFFFARQREVIRGRIEAKSEGWFARWLPGWRLMGFAPVRAFALILALFVSWTVFKTGRLPFMGPSPAEQTASVVGEVLLSGDTLSLLFETLLSGNDLPFLL